MGKGGGVEVRNPKVVGKEGYQNILKEKWIKEMNWSPLDNYGQRGHGCPDIRVQSF